MSTVLVVDDQPELRQLFGRVLEQQKYTVILAANGQEALGLLEQHKPDLVLLDMAMPQMDGLSFLRLVRQKPQWSRLPVIILSGLMSAEQVAEARKLGVNDQLIKAEFSMKELRSRVAKHLSNSTAANTT
ncbi:MAG TPA: response regulator, partial [Tepidisphaeraceae bacterium]|nr:response regulator [Tepidisphaeraceae bacterium]